MGTAEAQSAWWGARARDWAEVQEHTVFSLYLTVIDRADVDVGTRLLDIGCGAGLFGYMASEMGADVSGLDATPALLDIAQSRVPEGDFLVGEMEALPYADQTFEVVTGFNAFQYAASPVRALREARRVARPGGRVVIAVWGKPEDTAATGYFAALEALLPPLPPGAPGPLALSHAGALEALASAAGLTPTSVEEVDCLWTYNDEATALRGLLSAGPAVRAIQHAGEPSVYDAVVQAIAPFRTASGQYELKNTCRYLIARA